MKLYRIFISQPMKNRTEAEIDRAADRIIELFKLQFSVPEDSAFTIVNRLSFDPGTPRTKALGMSITHMEEAEYIIFAKGFTQANGCLVEYSVVNNYGDDWAKDPTKPNILFEQAESLKETTNRLERHRCFMEDTMDYE